MLISKQVILSLVLNCLAVPFCFASSFGTMDGQLASMPRTGTGFALDVSAMQADRQQVARVRLGFQNLISGKAKDRFWPVALYIETQSVEDDRDGIAFDSRVDLEGTFSGGGLYIGLPTADRSFDAALHFAISNGTNTVVDNIAVRGSQALAEFDQTNSSVALLLAPKSMVSGGGLRLQMTLGMRRAGTRFSVQAGGDLEPALTRDATNYYGFTAAGLQYPLGPIDLYSIIGFDDEPFVLLGIRL